MQKELLRALLRTAAERLPGLAGAGLLLLGLSAHAQTTTVFSEDFEGATPSFTTVNGTQANQWVVGTAGSNGPTSPGTKAAYISNDAGATNAYTLNSSSVVHLYRDVVLPAGQAAMQLSFDWKGQGESIYDYLLVQVAPTSFSPTAGTLPVAGSTTVLAQLNLQAAFGRTTLVVPASLAGTTQRLLFTWRNDAVGGAQPPASIDNVVLTARAASPLNGSYTLNNAAPTAGTNFTSFGDAAARLNLDGLGGPVTLTVSGGPYTEQFQLGQLPGSSATNTLTVNGGGSTIRFASASYSQRAVVQLNGTDYTTISNLTIDATGGPAAPAATYGYGVLLTNGADNDRIVNNVVTTNTTAATDYFSGIVASGVTYSPVTSGNSANNLTVEGNTVTGGLYGITLYGASAAALNTGNIVRNNTIRDTHGYGIYTAYQEGAQLTGNDIARPLRTTTTTFYGLYLSGSSRGLLVNKNRVHDPFTAMPTNTSTFYGIYVLTSTGATATATNDLVNNIFYNLNGNGAQYLIYNSGSANCRIYHNTLSSDDRTTTTTLNTYGIYNSGTPFDVKNNNITITRAGTGTKYGVYYLQNATTSNNNNIYVPGGNVGFFSTAFATLANWQTALGNSFDQNSRSADPQYVAAGTGNLAPANVVLNNTGTPLASVSDDITGAVRGAVPDPGAYEFAPAGLDVLPVALVSPAANVACYGTAEAVSVQFTNGGAAPLNLATSPVILTVTVTPNGGPAQTFTTTLNTGTLASGAAQTVTLPGTLDMSARNIYQFAITTTAAGDVNPGNDVLLTYRTAGYITPGTLAPATFSICFSGTATLGLTGSTGGNIQYQSSSSLSGPYTDVVGATSAGFITPVLTSTTYYRVRVSCNTSTAYSNVATITVNDPQLTTTNSPVAVCSGSPATLTATATAAAGNGVRLYTTATGGTALTTTTAGNYTTYTTPALTASTTYYAEAYTAGAETVGPAAYASTGQTPQTGGNAVYFTTNASTVINTVTVYLNAGQAAGTVTIDLRAGSTNTNGAVVNGQSRAFAVPAGPATGTAAYVVPLNYTVPLAGQYALYLAAATQGGLLRDDGGPNSTGFPYVSSGNTLTITGASVSNYYYFFYNWQIGSDCVNATRTPIQVTVNPVPAAPTLTATTQANGAILLTASPAAGATYQFYRGGVAVGTPGTSNTLLLASGTLNGSYTAAVLAAGCASAQSVAVAVTVTGTRTASLAGVSLLVYPIPTPDGQLKLELTGPQAKAATLTVLNALGQAVATRTLAPGTSTLSLASLAAGVYTLRVQTEQGFLTQKIVRE